MVYRLGKNAAGEDIIQSATIKDEKESQKLGKEWRDSPLQFNPPVETHPEAPIIPMQEFSIRVPEKSAAADVPTGA
jgi:hypothetical protein